MARKRLGISQNAAIAIAVIVIIIIIAGAYVATRGGGGGATTTSQAGTTTQTGGGAATTTETGGGTTSQTSTETGSQTTTTSTQTFTGPEAMVIETSNAYVVVGPKGAHVPQIPGGKPIIAVAYTVDDKKTKPVENSTGFVDIDPAFYRNHDVDALIMAARKATDPNIRYQLYEAIYKLSNEEVPTLWLGQYIFVRNYWDWVHGRYYHPTLAERFDLIWEDNDAPNVDIGIGNYANNMSTYVIVTHGWPDTFDPAADYETFGWAIWHNIGDALLTYWKEDTEHVKPDLAVAW
nr:DNA-binding protein [Desulfurococcales archaeon]